MADFETKPVYNKDYLKENLSYYPHKGIPRKYRVEEITENPALFDFIINEMCSMVKQIGAADGLVTSEARGFLFSPVARQLRLPLYLVRKENKLPGPTDKESYQ